MATFLRRMSAAAIIGVAIAWPAMGQGLLEGTSWQLVKFTSMDDRTRVPSDPARYTIAFGADGQLTVLADCNRGRGAWRTTAPSGLQIGPVAATKMACASPSMGDRLLRDLSDVASYTMRDGRLFLALRVDAGVYEFAPLGGGAGRTAASPSFDCRRVRAGSADALICRDDLLAALDREMTRLYRRATAAGAASGPMIRRDQPAWRRTRDDCLGEPAPTTCLRDRYAARIADLRAQSKAARGADAKGISLGPFPFLCEGIDGALTVTFINAEPKLARIQLRTRVWVMQAQPSGSGARYLGAAGESEMFWTHGREALFRGGADRPEAKCREDAIG